DATSASPRARSRSGIGVISPGLRAKGRGLSKPCALSPQPYFFVHMTMATTITAADVKKLRDATGAGMMECKAARPEGKGDHEEGTTILRKRGLASAAKKAGRATSEGLIGNRIAADHSSGALVEVNCESDFVARTDDFQKLIQDILSEID